MTFFNAFKNHPDGPPTPPRRPGGIGRNSWPGDDFDEDEGDMYEAPPCERAAIPTQPIDLDFIYLDRSSNHAAPQRKAAPPPRHMAPLPRQPVPPQRRGAPPLAPPRQAAPSQRQTSPAMRQSGVPTRPSRLTATGKVMTPQWDADLFYETSIKPPDVDRKEKPGKKSAVNMSPLPAVFSAPPPALLPDAEEDVYVDPNEEQGDSDNVYIEPTAVCPLSSRGPMRLPPSVSPSLAPPSSFSMMKPPVPRSMKNSLAPSISEVRPAPDGKRPMFAPPRPAKPPVRASQDDSQPRPPAAPTVDQIPGVTATSSTGLNFPTSIEDNEWFATCQRKSAEDLLLRINKDGAFLVRPSSSLDPRQPYTLAVLYRQKVYNIPVRYVMETQGYALGKMGKEFEETFESLQDIIYYHRNNQLVLIDSMSQATHKTYLSHPARSSLT